MKYNVKIQWSYRESEVKWFKSKEERKEYIDKREDDIDYCVLNYVQRKNPIMDAISSPYLRNMSDYEMDVLL